MDQQIRATEDDRRKQTGRIDLRGGILGMQQVELPARDYSREPDRGDTRGPRQQTIRPLVRRRHEQIKKQRVERMVIVVSQH